MGCNIYRIAILLGLGVIGGLQDLEGAHQSLIDTHHGTGVVKLSAVVGGREERDELALGKELVSLLDDLVGAADEVELLALQEGIHNVGTKGVRDTTVVLTPSGDLAVRVGPEQVAEETVVGDIGGADDALDLLHGLEIRAETSVHAEDLLVDDGSNREAVEAVCESFPEADVVTTLAFVVETVDSVDGGTLVVATEEEEVLRVLDLEGEEEADGLKTLLSTIDVVSEEEVVGLRGEASVLKESEKIQVLSVDVTADLDGGLKLKENGLTDKDLTGLLAEETDLLLSELDVCVSLLALDGSQETLDDVVDIKLLGHSVLLLCRLDWVFVCEGERGWGVFFLSEAWGLVFSDGGLL